MTDQVPEQARPIGSAPFSTTTDADVFDTVAADATRTDLCLVS